MSDTSDSRMAPEIESVANDIAQIIQKAIPDNYVFAFLFAPIGEEGRCSYISSGNHEDMLCLMKEITARMEGQPEMTGTA